MTARHFPVWLVTMVLVAASAQPAAWAQQRPPRVGPAIDYVFPAGAQRGKTVEVTIGGQNLKGVESVRVSGAGVTGTALERIDAKTIKASLVVAPEAAPGEREIRLVTPDAVSNRLRFLVGQLPEIVESEPNSERKRPETLPSLPVVVNGQLLQGDRDVYRFGARAGQTLVFAVDARRLIPYIADAVPGWNDVCLTLYDANGRELQSVDDTHLQPDPVLVFKVPRNGDYLLEVRDILFRGRADFVYRLSAGELPYLSSVYPLGGRRGTSLRVALEGVNLPLKALDVALPADSPQRREIRVSAAGLLSNGVPFAVGDAPESEEREPNDTPARANRVQLPVTINGRIQRRDDDDYFVFPALAGQRLSLEVRARRLDSLLDAVLTLFGPAGREIAENDDTVDEDEGLLTNHADARLVFTAPAAGDYVVRIRDAQVKGGAEFAYRLTIAPVHPDFTLHVSPDNPQVGPGGSVAILVTAARKDGMNGEIALAMGGLPPGFVSSGAVIAPGQSLAALTLTAPIGAAPQFFSPTVTGTAKVEERALVRVAIPAEEAMQAFSYRHTVPTEELLLAVGAPPPLRLWSRLPEGQVLKIPQGGEAEVVVKVARTAESIAPTPPGATAGPPAPEAKSQVVITAAPFVPLPPGVSVKTTFIAPEGDEVAVTITAAKSARAGSTQNLILAGSTTIRGQRVTRIAAAIPVRVEAAGAR